MGIFKSAIRTFFVSAFAIIGIFFGVVAVFFFCNILGDVTDGLEPENKVTILPDANGVRKELSDKAPIILQMDFEGIIGVDGLKREDIRSQLRESRIGDFEEDRVKGILLYINTPGGGAIDADEIYHSLVEYKERYKVPIYAYVEGICASGGIFVAAAADKVYASDSSLIGSVGVLIPTMMNFTKLMEKVGVESLTITSGKYKDPLNPFRPWKKDEEMQFQTITDYYYKQFIDIVVKNRPKMDKKKLINEYGAQVFPAPGALERGYIDQAGSNRSLALKELAQAAGIPEDEEIQVVRLEEKKWLKKFLQGNASALYKGTVTHTFKIPGEIDPELQNQFLYLYRTESLNG